jgi:hypothetical protein
MFGSFPPAIHIPKDLPRSVPTQTWGVYSSAQSLRAVAAYKFFEQNSIAESDGSLGLNEEFK